MPPQHKMDRNYSTTHRPPNIINLEKRGDILQPVLNFLCLENEIATLKMYGKVTD